MKVKITKQTLKIFLLLIVFVIGFQIIGCNNEKENEQDENNVQTYVPDLDDIMLHIQAHHAKLYFALKNENYPLAQFCFEEMQENFETIKKNYPMHDGVPLGKLVPQFIEPALKKIAAAIKKPEKEGALVAFENLTNSCNSCHDAAGHGFINIKIPGNEPFGNQDFTIGK